MKRFLVVSSAALLAITSILAQAPAPATLRTPSGDRPVAQMQQGGQPYFSASDVITALGGTVVPESTGFNAALNNVAVAFGPDSRFAVVGEDLIEMPAAPVVVEGKPFVPLQFFQGLLSRAIGSEVVWDPAGHLLTVRPLQQTTALAQVSVTNVQGISKVVVTLSAAVEYSIVKEQLAYTVRFRTPVKPPYTDKAHDDPNVSKTSFGTNEFRVQLTAPDIVADAYKLENPFRIVLDLRKGAAPVPGALVPIQSKPVDLPGVRTIVIDPGHGGKDVGALGATGTMEKDATLALCRRLVPVLEAKTGARVVLTREDDSIVSLDQRTALANQYKADLFLSVHMNAAVVKGARGSEVYFLSADASDEVARKAAETENAAGPISSPAPATASGDLKLILWDLAQQEYLQESSRLALDIQQEMNAIAGIQDRGVKQAPFKVLVGASMPAALVEVAFITNPDEEAKLSDDKFVTSVVDAITRAVVRYKNDYETRIGVIHPAPAAAPATAKPVAPGAQPPAAPAATSTARTGTQ